jgi:hypothetical protein
MFFFVFFLGWYGLGWYRVRVETPKEHICFFLGMEWGFGGARMGRGTFLGWYGVGDGKIPFLYCKFRKH